MLRTHNPKQMFKAIVARQDWGHFEILNYTLTNSDEYVGSFQVTTPKQSLTSSFHNFYIAEDYRRLGFGEAMLKEFLGSLDQGMEIVLNVQSQNEIATRLYLKMGFTEIPNRGSELTGKWLKYVK